MSKLLVPIFLLSFLSVVARSALRPDGPGTPTPAPTPAQTRAAVERSLTQANGSPGDTPEEVAAYADALAEWTELPRAEVTETPLAALAEKIRELARERDEDDAATEEAIAPLVAQHPFRRLTLAEVLRVRQVQARFREGQRPSDDEVAFLYTLSVTKIDAK